MRSIDARRLEHSRRSVYTRHEKSAPAERGGQLAGAAAEVENAAALGSRNLCGDSRNQPGLIGDN
jgi:hypothetical protein